MGWGRARRAAASALALGAASALAAGAAWLAVPVPAVSTGAILDLLPRGASIHSVVRLELDGGAPQEAAVVAAIPTAPGSRTVTHVALLVGSGRLRRRPAVLYRDLLPAPLPLSADAVDLGAGREAAVFSGRGEDGVTAYRVVGVTRGRVSVLREGRTPDRLRVDGRWIIESTDTAWAWDGRAFRRRPPPADASGPWPAVSWHYGFRGDAVVAATDRVILHLRQPLRVVGGRGGVSALVVPDSRLDLVEQGYRARRPGTYTIRVRMPLAPRSQEFVLTVEVR
ncbi:MAG: hypothetical protein QN173_01060 [Armatimonadota bacterium]|nr:hypothetical protein [Armatimonadota bacterium]MDR7437223.1 hypothetical protein [Armatimonadota bacterium]MDR7473023.1 hypothetical protein [Armatimonadota bacterium]MDR7506179.1 hypothetical protein [Armatimonadota bacterium]MDR7509116.1 hypothetical protein [Armatimonadota bacterium]